MSKGGNFLTILITSLIISTIVSTGVLYIAVPIVYPTDDNPQGPTIYSLSYDDIIDLDGISMVDYFDELELTYKTQPEDRVLIEFTCEVYLNPSGTTDLSIHFDINGTIFPTSSIRASSDSRLRITGYMRYLSGTRSVAGNSTVYIYAAIDDESTGSYIRYSLLTVTVY